MFLKNFFQPFWLHIKYTRILKNIYKTENLINNLSNLFGIPFRIDWVGRIYAIFNPRINNGMFDQNMQIYEYNENGLDASMLVEKRIMELLLVASKFVRAQNLFDLLTYKIKKLDDYDNYLFIIQPVTYEDFFKNIKKLSIFCILIAIVLAVIIFLI